MGTITPTQMLDQDATGGTGGKDGNYRGSEVVSGMTTLPPGQPAMTGAADMEVVDLLADLIVKCTEFGSQDGGFVAAYLLPTGPVHRAIPFLEQRGIIVRPGFDGRRKLAIIEEAKW